MKKRMLLLSCIFATCLLLQYVSANIYFSDLNDKYNIGDTIEVSVSVDPVIEGRLVKVVLNCEGSSVIEFNDLPEGGQVDIKLPLNFFTIEQANGNCYFIGDYAGENRNSNEFEISKKLIISLSNDAFFANPGEEIVVSGSAEKLNGELVNGEVEVTIPLLSLLDNTQEDLEEDDEVEEVEEEADEDSEEIEEDLEEEANDDDEEETENNEEEAEEVEEIIDYNAGIFYGKLTGGDFSVNIRLPEDIPAGNYRVDVLAYEEFEGIRSSEGLALSNLKVFQVLKEVDLALNNQNFDPIESVSIKPSLLDQTGEVINDEVSVVIKDEEGNRFFEKIIGSGETIDYQIPGNFSSGYYDIEAFSGEVKNIKIFYVNEKAIADFELNNETLTITNIGNIPYNKGVEIELNGKSFIKNVNLGLGESAKFKLTGPDEEYDVSISDGEDELSLGSVSLTGNFVGVDSIGEGIRFSGPIWWILIIVVLIIILLYFFRDVFKKKSFAFPFSRKKDFASEDKEIINGRENVKLKEEDHSQADQVLVLKGHKSDAAIVALKIKNKIGKTEKENLEKAIEPVYAKKGAVYEQGDFIFVVFSPLMTKKEKNEVEAAKAAQKIVELLNKHNVKFKDKIDFGIGINSGQIINKIEEGKLKFTVLGNFVVKAKRLAEASNKKVLVTKQSYEKSISQIKVDKLKIGQGEIYEIKGVIDTEKNKKFISNFLDRQKRNK